MVAQWVIWKGERELFYPHRFLRETLWWATYEIQNGSKCICPLLGWDVQKNGPPD